MMMMMIIMTVVSVEQRPGWGEHVQTTALHVQDMQWMVRASGECLQLVEMPFHPWYLNLAMKKTQQMTKLMIFHC